MKKLAFLTVLLVRVFLSCAQTGEWDTYIARYEKGPGSTLINMSLKHSAPDKNYPFLFAAGVKFNNCSAEGLPGPSALNSLNKISDSIVALISRKTDALLAGTFTYQCERKDYFYVKDTNGLKEAVKGLLDEHFKGYIAAFLVKKDREWDAYLNFLYPNEETRDYMGNQKIIQRLQKAGDKPELPRLIDHFLLFKTEADRECFAYTAISKKFTITAKVNSDNKAFPFSLHISRTDRADLTSMNNLTRWFREQVAKCRGTYDGWETIVIKQERTDKPE